MAISLPLRLLLSLALALAATTGLAATAHAEDGYRYWNYFHAQDGAWAFSEKGVADFVPEHGTTEGFRYGTSTVSQGVEPRVDPAEVDFAAICGSEPAPAGEKRVAVVVDFGTESDAEGGTPPEPVAECAQVPADASTQQVLQSFADVRTESGMACALDGYPAKGCGEPVKNAEVPSDEPTVAVALPEAETDNESDADTANAASETADGGGTLPLVLAALVLIVLLGVGGLVLSRRSKV